MQNGLGFGRRRNKRARQWPIRPLIFASATMCFIARNILPQTLSAKEPTNVDSFEASDAGVSTITKPSPLDAPQPR